VQLHYFAGARVLAIAVAVVAALAGMADWPDCKSFAPISATIPK